MIVTFPGGYHAGFNEGRNVSEAWNMGSEKWIEKGRVASFCRCPKADEPIFKVPLPKKRKGII